MDGTDICSSYIMISYSVLFLLQEDDSSPGSDDDGLMGCGLVDVVSLEKGIFFQYNYISETKLKANSSHIRNLSPY